MSTEQTMSEAYLMGYDVKPVTLTRYHAAYKRFRRWARHRNLTASTPTEWDHLLVQWIHYKFEKDSNAGSRRHCEYCKAFIRKFNPDMPLRRAAQSLRGWKTAIPSMRTIPLPYGLVLLLTDRFVRHGRLDYAVLTLVSFECLLRTMSEFLPMSCDDVALPGDRQHVTDFDTGILRIRFAKTGEEQNVQLFDSTLGTLLLALYVRRRRRRRRDTLFGAVTAGQFRAAFMGELRDLGLSHIPFRAYGLRHGGATYCHACGMDFPSLKTRGRWKADASALMYVSQGKTLVATLQLPRHVEHLCARMIKQPSHILRRALAQFG